MTRIIEFAVVRHEGFDDIRVRHACRLYEFTILCDEAGIVFPNATVVILFRPVNGNVAEDDGNSLSGSDNVTPVILAVAQI